ncbi:MAG: YIP1 family protein [Shimia sp.]
MNGLISLIGLTILRPREAAQQIIRLPLDLNGAFAALGVAIIFSVLLSFFLSRGAPVPMIEGVTPFTPIMLAGFVLLTSGSLAIALAGVGKAMGGQGEFRDMLLLVAWLQVMQIAGQVIQSAMFTLSPALGSLTAFVILGGLLWILVCFIDEMHGLASIGRAIFLLLMAIVGVGLGLTLLLGLAGVGI